MSDLNKLVPDPTKRYNPLIKPTDAAWKEVEYTFRRMLDRPTVTIKQVLDNHFTPHERKLFLPAVEPRSLRECQEDSTRRYRALLAGRFKGHFPSLATKFAMLYFGLPVEPALSQFAQLSKPSFEIDDWEQLHEAEVSPPLHFLTAHDRRNFGYDHLRGSGLYPKILQVSDTFSQERRRRTAPFLCRLLDFAAILASLGSRRMTRSLKA